MSYELFMEKCGLFGEIPLSIAHDLLDELFAKAGYYDEEAHLGEDTDENLVLLSKEYLSKASMLTRFILDSDELSGDGDDYHNFAMVLSRHNMSKNVIAILEKGLQRNTNNIDLLADYLQTVSEGAPTKPERASEIFSVLKSIPFDEWNWRAFKFSIDYLNWIKSHTSGVDDINKQIEETIGAFKLRKPNEALAYVCESDYIKESNPQKAKAILEEANELFGEKNFRNHDLS